MDITNITDITDDYDNMALCNCTDNEYEYDINLTIPLIFITIPCCLSFLCLISLMVYTLVKPLMRKK